LFTGGVDDAPGQGYFNAAHNEATVRTVALTRST
jgi:hypothetical protein